VAVGATAEEADGVEYLAEWVRSRADEVAEKSTAAIWAEVEAYQRLADHSLRREVTAHCHQVFSAFRASVGERRNPRRSDFPWTANHAMRRVDLGISLPDFMQAFRIGQITLWEDILEGVRAHPPAQGAALLMVEHVMRTVEVGSTAAAEAYLEAQQYQLADHARIARDLLEDLVVGRPPLVGPRVAALAATGITDAVPLVVVVATPVAEPAGAAARLRPAVRTALGALGTGLVVERHEEVAAILPAADGTDRLVADLRRAVGTLVAAGVPATVGVSAQVTGLDAVPDAYEQARTAHRALGDEHGVQCVGDLSALDVLVRSQDESAVRLLRPEVRAFVEEDLAGDGVLLATLREYVACDANAKLAAMRLHVHSNTVYYRLERIAERTGCDPRRVEELIELLLAVRLVGPR
jgi:hypothetical protein